VEQKWHMTSNPEPPSRGRPRDPSIDALVLETTRELLSGEGFAATTVQEISRRSGVHPPAIYRRWPSRLALIEDAAFSDLGEVAVRPTGDLARDLRRFVRAYERALSGPAARAAMPGLVASHHADATTPPEQWIHLSLRPQFYEILAAAPDDVDPDVDPDQVFDLVLGAVLAGILVPPIAKRRNHVDSTVELLVRLLRPAEPTRRQATGS
jgi:AcrR family transcriptional regulator